MYARVVRFSGVTEDAIAKIRSDIEASDGPPPGVKATGMRMFWDADQGTSLFVSFYDTEEDMAEADKVFEGMDRGDTPGERLSVDRCELVIEREA
jgi:hypothetical protein